MPAFLLRKWCPVFLPLILAAATDPSGEPALREGLDPASVTPGTLGFLATLFIVIGVFFLIRDMTKRIRRVRYSSMVQDARLRNAAAFNDGGTEDENDGRPSGGSLQDASDNPYRETQTVPGGKHGPAIR